MPKDRFEQLLIREGRGHEEKKEGAVRKQECSLGQDPGSASRDIFEHFTKFKKKKKNQQMKSVSILHSRLEEPVVVVV